MDMLRVEAAREGDRAALESLATELLDAGRGMLRAMTRSDSPEEDPLNEAVLAYLRGKSGLQAYQADRPLEAHFQAFLRHKVLHAGRSAARRGRRQARLEPDLAADRAAGPATRVEDQEADEVVQAIRDHLREALEPWQYRAYELHLDGQGLADIRATLIEERGECCDPSTLADLFDRQVPATLAAASAHFDATEPVAFLLEQAERRRQLQGQIGWSRTVLDTLLDSFAGRAQWRSLRVAEIDLLLRCQHLRAQVALDQRDTEVWQRSLENMERHLPALSASNERAWRLRHQHTRGRTFHNDHDYLRALGCYERAMALAPRGGPEGTLLRDHGSALRGAGRPEEARRQLLRAAEWFRRRGDPFQAARCESIAWRALVDAALRAGCTDSAREAQAQLEDLENREEGMQEGGKKGSRGNPLAHVQHRLNYLAALAVAGDLDRAVAEAVRLDDFISARKYYRQQYELIEVCRDYELLAALPRPLRQPPKPRHARKKGP